MFTTGRSSNVRTGGARERVEHHGHQLPHRGAGDDTDAAARPALELVGAGLDLALEPAHAADAVLDLIEAVVDLGRWQLDAGPHVQLVGAEGPVDATLAPRDRRTSLHEAYGRLALLGGRLTHEVMLAELGEPDRHHRTAEDRPVRTRRVSRSVCSSTAPSFTPGDITTCVWNSMPWSAKCRS